MQKPEHTPFLDWFANLRFASPKLRTAFWKWWYNFISKRYAHVNEFTCMNFGYLVSDEIPTEAIEYSSLRLYEYAAAQLNLDDQKLLEIGCGRGGGLHHLLANNSIQTAIGIDLSEQSINFCRQRFSEPNLQFLEGSADHLPIDTNSVDAIINVESSHTYPEFKGFLNECTRVLKKGGQLSIVDFRPADKLDEIYSTFGQAGFVIEKRENISKNVLLALETDESKRRALVGQHAPKWLQWPILQFAGIPGSKFYNDLQAGRTIYFSIIASKK